MHVCCIVCGEEEASEKPVLRRDVGSPIETCLAQELACKGGRSCDIGLDPVLVPCMYGEYSSIEI